MSFEDWAQVDQAVDLAIKNFDAKVANAKSKEANAVLLLRFSGSERERMRVLKRIDAWLKPPYKRVHAQPDPSTPPRPNAVTGPYTFPEVEQQLRIYMPQDAPSTADNALHLWLIVYWP